ncbi:hypothetical protein EDC01DRAFT_139433 [Geopyxis carbonaria]|nr:hypothetical protein EDC01DRAFT_139433 [Geopyxis carbonaria]
MPSPSKRRKKSNQALPKGKTLDFFFSKTSESKSPTPALEPSTDDALTDEQYARKLAEEWAKEDRTHRVSDGHENGSLNLKRRRSSSQEHEDHEFSARVQMKNQSDEQSHEDTPGDKASNMQFVQLNTETPPAPRKPEISIQAEQEIEKTIDSIPFDTNPLEFDPDVYENLIENWPEGRATYGLLTRAFVLVNATRSRIKIVDTLVNFLRTLIRLDPESLLAAVWLTTNDIGPPYENNELGIGSSIISKAITRTSGITPAALKKLYHKYGDPGDVAFDAKAKQKTLMMRKPTPLTVNNVYKTLVKISKSSGKGSQDVKEGLVKRLLVDAKGEEIRYLTRTFIQHLRIGAVKTTMLIALARAFTLSSPRNSNWECPRIHKDKEALQELFGRAEEIMKQCFARRPNYNDLVPALLEGGIEMVDRNCVIALHVPLKPMLGSITRDLEEMLVKLQGRDFSCEYKYDGQRAQIHCDDDGKVTIFSRHLELMTDKYPDLVELVPQIRGEDVRSFILEGEVVAVDKETGKLMPFQTLAGRERKNVELANISVTVCLFAFDLMCMNGEELLSQPFRKRRELLRTKFIEIPKHFTWVKSLDSSSTESAEVRDFFKSALVEKCEGIMVKVLDNSNQPIHDTAEEEAKAKSGASKKKGSRRKALLATYEPDKRLESWLKVKKDYDSAADTLDLIPIGGWHGSGRKAKWWSPILLAVRNPDSGSLEAVCKCMSGFNDKYYAEMKEFYSEDGENTSKTKKGFYESELRPAVWFEAKEVWEVAFADITISPTYTAALGLVSEERGLSLRFPRFLRKREDKSIDEASTSQFLADLYFKQIQTGGTKTTEIAAEEVEDEVDDLESPESNQEDATKNEADDEEVTRATEESI